MDVSSTDNTALCVSCICSDADIQKQCSIPYLSQQQCTEIILRHIVITCMTPRRQEWLGLTSFGCFYRFCWTRQPRTTTLPFLTAVASLSLRRWNHSSSTHLAVSIWLKTSLFTWASLWREALAAALVSPLAPVPLNQSFKHSLAHSLTQSITHSCTHSFAHWLIHSSMHPFMILQLVPCPELPPALSTFPHTKPMNALNMCIA